METQKISIDGGLHFNAEDQGDGHVLFTVDVGSSTEALAQYCSDTQELTLFDVTSKRQATDVVKTQLNHTVEGLLGNPTLATLMAAFGFTEVSVNA